MGLNKKVSIRLTENEYELIKKQADCKEESISDYIRTKALERPIEFVQVNRLDVYIKMLNIKNEIVLFEEDGKKIHIENIKECL